MGKPTLAGNVIAKGILNLFNALLPLIVTRYVYHVLGPTNVGNIEYGMAIMGYFSVIGLLGTYNYGLREISSHQRDHDKVHEILKNLVCINVISNTFIFTLYLVFVFFFVHDPTLRIICWILSANILAQVFYMEYYNEAMEQFRFITIKTMIVRLISLAFIFILVRRADDLYYYAAITSGVVVANYLVSYIYNRRKVPQYFRGLWRGLNFKPFIVPLLMIMLLNNTTVLYTMADRIILGYFVDADNVAYLSLSSKIVEMTRTLLLSIVYATLPRLSLYLHEDRRLYQEQVLKIMQLVLFLIIPTSMGLLLLSPQVIDLFGGPQYADAVPVMRLFAIRMTMLGVEAIMYNQIIFLHGKEKQLVLFNLLCGFLNIIFNFAILPWLNSLTSMMCTFAAEIVFELLCLRFIHKKLNVRLGIKRKSTLMYFLASLLFIPVVWATGLLNPSTTLCFIINIPVCILVYMVFMRMIHDPAYMLIEGYFVKFLRLKHKSDND